MGNMTAIIPLMKALEVHSRHYVSYGDYSVTTLIDTPRRVQLLRRHAGNLHTPPESQAASFVGTGVHNYWESCLKAIGLVDPDFEVERRVVHYIEDRLISGRFDILYQQDHIFDIKTCKVWKLIFDPNKEEWTQQQNLYAYLLGLRGVKIKKISIIAQFLDWIQSNAIRDREYPQEAVLQFDLDLWSPGEQEMYLLDRLTRHKSCENVEDNELPECTRLERWERWPGGYLVKYAVMKTKEAKKATRVFTNLHDAIAYFKQKNVPSTGVIEVRYAVRKRCEDLCACNLHCNDYISYCGRKANDKLNDYYTYEEVHAGIQ